MNRERNQGLRPFWNYYGGKWRAAPHYPAPVYGTIVEPFAGAAGYSLRYPSLRVVLVERYAVIAEMWRFLIGASPADIRAIPVVENIDDLPSSVPEGGRYLVGFLLNAAAARPCRTLSAGLRRQLARGIVLNSWGEKRRERIAQQVDVIRHWQIIEGDYAEAPDIEATWFVDPPYQVAGRHYVHSDVDYETLGAWCRARRGQVLVCENEGADWLPFRRHMSAKAWPGRAHSAEVLWSSGSPYQMDLALSVSTEEAPE